MSIKHGIKSPELINAVDFLSNRYKNKKIYSIELGKFFSPDYLDIE
jgi:putative hydrolase of HD superfamily